MILGIEIALIIFGLLALARGKFNVGKGKDLVGARARVLGALCLLPFPVAMTLGFAYGLYLGTTGVDAQGFESYSGHFMAMEVAVIVGTLILVAVLGSSFYKKQEAERAAGHPPE